MDFRSIPVRMQLWHGLILLSVLILLGYVSYQSAYWQKINDIDSDLHRYSQGLSRTLTKMRPRRHDLPSLEEPKEGKYVKLHVISTPSLDNMFVDSKFYYAIFSPDREARHVSGNAPDGIALPLDLNVSSNLEIRSRGNYREFISRRKAGFFVIIGKNITEDLEEIYRYRYWIGLIGFLVVTVALFIGWWLDALTLRPISQIASTAERISAGDLSDRIDSEGMGTELEKLADVLNTSFDQLQSIIAKQNRFVADASHELRTPISIVLTQAQSALTKERQASEYKHTVEACERAAKRMSKLAESLLTLAKLDSGETKGTLAEVSLEAIASEAVEMLRPLATASKVEIRTLFSPLRCYGSASQLNQVFVNLISNAIQYNKEGGVVEVDLSQQDGLVVLKISDNGIGIDEEGRQQLFDRFFRVDKARSTQIGGTGLGLAIVSAIVTAHKGSIKVESELGVGSSFIVTIPALNRL